MVRPLDLANHIVSTTFPVNISGCSVHSANVKLVKHMELVSLAHSLETCIFVSRKLVIKVFPLTILKGTIRTEVIN